MIQFKKIRLSNLSKVLELGRIPQDYGLPALPHQEKNLLYKRVNDVNTPSTYVNR